MAKGLMGLITPGLITLGLITLFSSSISLGFTLMRSPKPKIDYSAGVVFYERERDSLFLGYDSIISLEHYLSKLRRESALEVWQRRVKDEQGRERGESFGEGLFGPIDIPTPLVKSKIDITGGDEIHFGGRQTIHTGKGYGESELSGFEKWFPQLEMKQKLDVNLIGSIGENISTTINYNSERMIQAENEVKLKFTGGEDDIIKEIGLGNTQISIPSSGYIGTLPTQKGLFGISAHTQFGGVNLYTILSQEQASSNTETFEGYSQVTTDTIYDSDFERRRLFFIPTPDGDAIDPENFYVYIDDGDAREQDKKRPGLAVPNPPDTSHIYSGDIDRGWFTRLESDRYTLNIIRGTIMGRDTIYTIILELDEQLSYSRTTHVLAVIYKTKGETWVGDTTYGVNKDSLLLQIITPTTLSSDSELWDLEIKNIYRIAPPNTQIDTIRIYKRKVGTQGEEVEKGETYLKILGLDSDGNGKVEWPYYDVIRGYLIFPDLHPFASPALSEPDSIIYEKAILKEGEGDKYYILVKHSSSSETFDLNAMGEIIEESERVMIGSRECKRDIDYTIDYQRGIVTFKTPVLPNEKVNITFSTNELFSSFQKSLVGVRAEWDIFGRGKMGSGLFYRSVAMSGDEKAQIGLEPYSRMIGECDFAYDIEPMFITRAIDKLPLVSTDAPSSISFFAETGVSIPNPNTMGAAYIEDFEGQERSEDIGFGYLEWSWASGDTSKGKDTSNFAKEPLLWYSPIKGEVLKKGDVYPNALEPTEALSTYLKIVFTPSDTSSSSWAGLMRGMDPSIDISRAQYIMAVIRTHSGTGRLHIDFGSSIYKDVPRRDKGGNIVGYNGILDTEDKNHDGVKDSDEDTGLDGVEGEDSEWPNIPGDDGNDDFDFEKNPNGMEGNGILNTEDLNHNGKMGSNKYYSLEVSLETSHYIEDLKDGFKLLQIPLTDTISLRKVGDPDSSRISLIRVWFDGFDTKDTIELISLGFKGSNWRDLKIAKLDSAAPEVDTTEKVDVSQISQEIDTSYTSPFKVSTYKMTPMGEERRTEASLQMKYIDIKPKHQITLCRYTFSRNDYREYRTLKMYLHNDENDPVAFLRIGTDSLNYYEYSAHISRGDSIKPGWYEFVIDLDSFPPLKKDTFLFIDKVPNYSVKGYPSLSSISYISIGLKNTSPHNRISGKVWFNDIRLTDPRAEIGAGFHTQARLSLADLASIYFDESRSDPNFKTFSSPRGVGTGAFTQQRSIQTSLSLNKFLPKSWGFNIPLSYNWTRIRNQPKYSLFENDRLLSKEESEKEQGGSENKGFNVRLSKGKSENKLLNYTLDALSFNVNQGTASSLSSLERDSSQSTRSSLSYSISPNLGFDILNRRFSFFPQSIRLSGSQSRGQHSRSTRIHPDSGFQRIQTDVTNTISPSLGLRYTPISSYLSTDFQLNQSRDLRESVFWKGIKIGREASRDQNFNTSVTLPLKIITPEFRYGGTYNINSPREMDSLSNIGNTHRFSVSTRFGLGEPLKFLIRFFSPKGDSGEDPNKGFAKTLQEATRFIRPISLSFNEDRSSNYQGVVQRPGLGYQLGLVDSISDTLFTSSNKTAGMGYSASSGMDIRIVSLSTSFSRSISYGSYLSSNTENSLTSWPNLGLSISRVEALLGPWAMGSSVSSNFNVTNNQSGVAGKPPEKEVKSLTFSPLLSWYTTWKRDISTTFSMSYSRTNSYLPNSITQEENKGGEFTTSYSFSAPTGINFPLLRKIKFKSTLSLSLNLKYNSTSSMLYPQNKEPYPERNYDTFNSNIQGSYGFSSAVTGGLTLGYDLLYDKKQSEKTHSTNLEFFVRFRF